MSGLINRRQLFASALASIRLPNWLASLSLPSFVPSEDRKSRSQDSLAIRTNAASLQSSRKPASMAVNGDEDAVPNRAACFVKGLPQNQFAEVSPAAYDALLKAVRSESFTDFEKIPRAGGRRLSNPQSAFTYHLEGGDSHTFDIPPAPSITAKEVVPDTAELYWMSLCRDIPFSELSKSPIVAKAAADLGVTPATVFRGPTKGDLNGPYLSQFFYKPIPYGATRIDQRYEVPMPGSDFMTAESEWSQINAGFPAWRSADYDPQPRYLRNGRDLAEYVHYDFAYQAYLNAALILVNSSRKTILNCNQFKSSNNPYRYSTVEEGFTTFGPPEAIDWLGRVTTAALKAAYCQKWMVHRRLRPEALGGLIHLTRLNKRHYPVHNDLLHSEAVEAVFHQTGAYLLPQAYPEGAPMHPSYPAGHAAIAGACAVILKATFDGFMLMPDCREPSADGLTLKPCEDYFPTIEDEINKLAFNISTARSWGGIHFRSDNIAGLKLGEDVGISVLQDLARTFTEDFKGFSLNRFNGKPIHIARDGALTES
jgi:hypothetical protein